MCGANMPEKKSRLYGVKITPTERPGIYTVSVDVKGNNENEWEYFVTKMVVDEQRFSHEGVYYITLDADSIKIAQLNEEIEKHKNKISELMTKVNELEDRKRGVELDARHNP